MLWGKHSASCEVKLWGTFLDILCGMRVSMSPYCGCEDAPDRIYCRDICIIEFRPPLNQTESDKSEKNVTAINSYFSVSNRFSISCGCRYGMRQSSKKTCYKDEGANTRGNAFCRQSTWSSDSGVKDNFALSAMTDETNQIEIASDIGNVFMESFTHSILN